MRHQKKIAVAAVAEHADAARLEAQLLVAAEADAAFAASHPGIHQPPVADRHAARLRADRHDLADVLMAERDRQLHSALDDAQALAAAEIEVAVGQMQIAVADAGGEHLEQHLGAGRLGRGMLRHLKRCTALADLKASHRVASDASPSSLSPAPLFADEVPLRACRNNGSEIQIHNPSDGIYS